MFVGCKFNSLVASQNHDFGENLPPPSIPIANTYDVTIWTFLAQLEHFEVKVSNQNYQK